jgi:D-alanyl-D-alanine carboxypeptidase
MSRSHRTRVIALAAAAAIALLAAGCSSTVAPHASPTASANSSACVASPDRVLRETRAPAAELPASLTSELDAAAKAGLAETSSPGTIVAVQTPQGRWIKALGVADSQTGTPMSVDDVQRIGSVTKTFTGTLILQLAEHGDLSLDDTIDRYVDGVPNGSTITLRMLLDMTSGLASYTRNAELVNAWFANPTAPWTPAQLLTASFALPPEFTPGAKFDYSNTNFILLGEVVEKVTGMTFADALDENVLAPLGLHHTAMSTGTALADPHAQGYTLQGTSDTDFTPVDATGWDPSFASTAGEMTSTVGDMLVWARALTTGHDILDADAQTARLASVPGKAGYGLAVGCIDGWFGHTGEIPGFNTSLFTDTRSGTSVVVFTNSDIPSGTCSASKTEPANPSTAACMNPATRIFVELSKALDRPFTPNPMS